jgi:phosphate acetyltransferase
MSGLIERARKRKKTIAFPEGTDARALEEEARLAREGVVKPVLIGARPANAPEGVEFVDPANSPLVKKYAALYYERRRAKGTTHKDSRGPYTQPD